MIRKLKMLWVDFVVIVIILRIGLKSMNEVAYEFYLKKGDKLRAWLLRPIYSFKICLKKTGLNKTDLTIIGLIIFLIYLLIYKELLRLYVVIGYFLIYIYILYKY